MSDRDEFGAKEWPRQQAPLAKPPAGGSGCDAGKEDSMQLAIAERSTGTNSEKEASTAALDPGIGLCDREASTFEAAILRQRRLPRHPASGLIL